MRDTYHISLSSHDEVMYRNPEDLIYGFNCIAMAAYGTESRLLADAELTTHYHNVVQCDKVDEYVNAVRYPYSRYFNYKYHRTGRLGERDPFTTRLEGLTRQLTAISYVNRQGLHHGLSSTPFGYEYCSSNAFFRKELGKGPELESRKKRHPHFTRKKTVPEKFRIDINGMILREDAIDIRYVQELYMTPRNYLYQMNRFTDELWTKEQIEESRDLPLVTLESIEGSVDEFNLKNMLINERGRLRNDMVTDLDICQLIDTKLIMEFTKREDLTIYDLDMHTRRSIGNKIWAEYGSKRCSAKQIRRCAIIK